MESHSILTTLSGLLFLPSVPQNHQGERSQALSPEEGQLLEAEYCGDPGCLGCTGSISMGDSNGVNPLETDLVQSCRPWEKLISLVTS